MCNTVRNEIYNSELLQSHSITHNHIYKTNVREAPFSIVLTYKYNIGIDKVQLEGLTSIAYSIAFSITCLLYSTTMYVYIYIRAQAHIAHVIKSLLDS